MVQMTRDGYIARPDGKRDWYLNPEMFGVYSFFRHASAMLYYEDGEYIVESEKGETTTDTDLGTALSRWEHVDGYMAIEATPDSQPALQYLLTSHYIDEIHLLLVPVDLGCGLTFPIAELKSRWREVKKIIMGTGPLILYLVYREDR